MQVRVSIRGGIVIDNDVYSFDIDTTTKNIGGDKDAFFEGLERGISTYTKRNCQVSSPQMENDLDVPFLLGKT